MKRLLIIGAGFLQSFLIKKAKEMGYYTLAIDKDPKAVGFNYSDEYAVIDIVDKEKCLKYATEKNIDGVITGATDYGVLSTAYIAEKLELPGLKYEVAKNIKNKYIVRRILFEEDVDDIDQYYEISNINEIDKLIHLITFPVMVKPCDGSGSKATQKVNSIKSLKNACKEAIEASLIGKALIEGFIEGVEYGVESFVYKGETNVLGIMDKCMTTPPVYAELGHGFPSKLEIKNKVKAIVEKAIKVLNINFGAVNMDVIVTKDNRVCIVDVGARMGGNLIGSHLIPIGTGLDYMGSLIKASVEDKVYLKSLTPKHTVVTKILALKPGKVLKLPDFKNIEFGYKVEIQHHLKEGSLISTYNNNLDGYGYVISVGEDLFETEIRAEKAIRYIDSSIEREKI